jgi:hypothetical protein
MATDDPRLWNTNRPVNMQIVGPVFAVTPSGLETYCRYCRSWFYPWERDEYCPNCGAKREQEKASGGTA